MPKRKIIVTLVRQSEARVVVTCNDDREDVYTAVHGLDTSKLAWTTPVGFDIEDYKALPTKAEQKKIAKRVGEALKQAKKSNWVWQCKYSNHASNWKDSESCAAGSKRPSTKASAVRSAERHQNSSWHPTSKYSLEQTDRRSWR